MKIRILPLLFLLLIISCRPENSPPEVRLSCMPPEGNVKTLFDLDASASDDPDGLQNLLVFRWDILDDGKWETPFGPYRIFTWQFPEPGDYAIRVEVRDSYMAISAVVYNVHVNSLLSITDPRDGQVYPVVNIGSYWWFGRNLNIGKIVDPSVVQTNNGVIEKYIYPAADPDSLNGGLYSWSEMMGSSYNPRSQGICPPGWHVPDDADWKDLFGAFWRPGVRRYPTYRITGEKFIPDRTVEHDNFQAEGAIWRLLRETGSTGFDVVPLGYRDPDGGFSDRDYHFPGQTATFWTSSLSGEYGLRVRFYQTDDHAGDAFRLADNRRFAFSVRCVKESL